MTGDSKTVPVAYSSSAKKGGFFVQFMVFSDRNSVRVNKKIRCAFAFLLASIFRKEVQIRCHLI